jgi:predicted dehydrogenase
MILGTTMHGYGMIFGATNPQSFSYGFPIEAGANLLTIPFGHAIDALCWVLGEFDYVSATLLNERPNFPITDNEGKVVGESSKTAHDHVSVTGTLQKSGGLVTVIYEGGMNPSGGPGFVWQVNGTKGTALLEGQMGHLQMFQPKIKFGKVGEEVAELKDVKWVENDFSYAVGEAWNAFDGKGEGCVTTFEDALLRHKMIEAIYRSNESGKRECYP